MPNFAFNAAGAESNSNTFNSASLSDDVLNDGAFNYDAFNDDMLNDDAFNDDVLNNDDALTALNAMQDDEKPKQWTLHFDVQFGAGANMLIASLLTLIDSLEEGKQAQISELLSCERASAQDLVLFLEQSFNAILPDNERLSLLFREDSDKGCAGYYFDTTLPESTYSQEHEHEYVQGHEHAARGPQELKALICKWADTLVRKGLDEELICNTQQKAQDLVEQLAQAEAKAHGIPVEDVHFHELGALDCFVDLTSFSFLIQLLLRLFEELKISCSELGEGRGLVNCAHGLMPLPGFAVSRLLEGSQLKLKFLDEEGEHLTPSATVCLLQNCKHQLSQDAQVLCAQGIGIGSRDFSHPNIVRVQLYNTERKQGDSLVYQLEFVIDDMSAEALADLQDQLLSPNNPLALEAYVTPCVMKKGRAGHKLSLLCSEQMFSLCSDFVFKQSSTLGFTYQIIQRQTLKRAFYKVKYDDKSYQVKLSWHSSYLRGVRVWPEHEEVKRLACDQDCSYLDAQRVMLDLCLALERTLLSSLQGTS